MPDDEKIRPSDKDDYAEGKRSPVDVQGDVQSVSDREEKDIGITDSSELQKAGLESAFRFAAWSSVILVSGVNLDNPCFPRHGRF